MQVGVDIATGLVVVGDLIGAGAAQEQAVVGDTPNLAARLQALAEPGAVVIASSTGKLIGGLFEYRDLGTVELKGFAKDVPAWQVLGTGGHRLTIPLISDEPVNIGEKRLLAHELGELLYERPQPSLLHGWHELVVHRALPEQRVHPPFGGAGFEMFIEAESFSGGAE